MKLNENKRTIDQVVRLLKLSQPFQKVDAKLLKQIANIVRFECYDKGEAIYEIGTPAEDMFIIISGKVQHSFTLGTGAKDQVNVLKSGDLFGWAGLFKIEPHGQSKRLAKAVCLEEAELMVIHCVDMLDLVKTHRDSYDALMSAFVELIVREFSVPRNWLGFVGMDGKIVRNEADPAMANVDKRFLY
jgi:CRP-like cAMP-binding protein